MLSHYATVAALAGAAMSMTAALTVQATSPPAPGTSTTGIPSSERAAARVGIYPNSLKPLQRSVKNSRRTSVGVRFTTERAGTVRAVQFFRARANLGRQQVKLWKGDGTLVGRGAYQGRKHGWVNVKLKSPVVLQARRRYVASYVAPRGRYSRTGSATYPRTANGLTAQRGLIGRGGAMPRTTRRANFFVDVVFKPSQATTVPPIDKVPPGVNELNLPRIGWEGGPAYWAQFPKANQSGWDEPDFFPISVFYGKPEHAAQLRALGINTYMAAEHDGTSLKYITDRGMFVLAQQEEFTPAEVGNNPGVVGWFISDECEMGYSGCPEGPESATIAKEREYVSKVRGYADGRFAQANFGNGILRTFWAPTTMAEHVQLMDAASADKYTYTSPHIWDLVPRSPDWPKGAQVASSASYGWQVDQMKKFQDPAKLRPIWTFIETAMPLLEEAGAISITPDQLEGAAWSAIIHEARGVAFFQHNNNGRCGNYSLLECGPALQSKVKALTAQIRQLAPVINTQSYVYDFANGTDTMLKAYNGSAYIFADVGLLESPGSKTFTLPAAITGETVTVVGENRTIAVTGRKFTDDFAAEYTHHIYQVAQ